jgi:BOP1NT (NUC169) domain
MVILCPLVNVNSLTEAVCRTSAFDKNTQMDKPLTAEELDIVRRLESLENPDADYNPYEPTVEWFTGKGKEEVMPLSAAPEPKRRWIPSKWEKQKVCFNLFHLQIACLARSPGHEDRARHPPRPYSSLKTKNDVVTATILRHLE